MNVDQAQEGAIVRRDGLGNEMERRTETASTAMAARAQAQIQARYVMALQRPRDWDQVRQNMLKECSRPNFAEVARYSKPQGGKPVTGWSIRFAEMAAREMGNIMCEAPVISDDVNQRTLRCSATDLEKNTSFDQEITIEKTKERSSLKAGDVAISKRTNSYGKTTYLLPATEDEMAQKQSSNVSKTLRNLIIRLVPGDLLDECLRKTHDTLENRDREDPDAARKRLADAFGELGVSATDLSEYLGGRPLASVTQAELVDLRGVFVCLKEGGIRWPDLLEASPYIERPEGAKPNDKVSAVAEKVEAATARIKQRAGTKKPNGRPAEPPLDEQLRDSVAANEREPGSDG